MIATFNRSSSIIILNVEATVINELNERYTK